MSELKTMVAAIVADGKVDGDEVTAFRGVVFADGKIEREEADAAFAINDAVGGNAANDAGWQPLFVDVISAFVLGDETSPDAIDEGEADYLATRIQGDGQIDPNEIALLRNLKAKAKGTIPSTLSALFTRAGI